MEELKLILETVSSLGGSAKWLFIAYLGKELFIYVLGFGCLFTFLFTLGKIIGKLIEGLSLTEKIKAQMGFSGELTGSQKQTILNTISKGLATENKPQG